MLDTYIDNNQLQLDVRRFRVFRVSTVSFKLLYRIKSVQKEYVLPII